MCFNQRGDISTLNRRSLKLLDKFNYLGSSVSSADTRLAKAWTAIDRLSAIWKSDLSDKIKHSLFQAAVGSILLYRCTTWMLTKFIERKLDSNCKRMLRAELNKSWGPHSTKQLLYGHLPISKAIQIRQARHAGHCRTRKREFISDVLLWTSSHGRAMVGRPARTNLQQLCTDTGCRVEDLPKAMDDKDEWRKRVREIHVSDTP